MGDDEVATGADAPLSHVAVLCLDAEGSLLLLRRQDPLDGHQLWEPPGGMVGPGETLVEAAASMLQEQAGIEAVPRDRYVVVHRDDTWKGIRRVREEACFFVAIGESEVQPGVPTGEDGELVEWRFVRPSDMDRLDAPVHPADPFSVLSELLGC